MMKIIKKLIAFSTVALIICAFTNITLAAENTLQCKVNVTKSTAWKNYTVTIKMIDFMNKDLLDTFVLSAETQKSQSINNVEKPFDCLKHRSLQFTATFSPEIWKNTEKDVYPSIKFWDVSKQVLEAQANGKAKKEIIINVKFPDDFNGVPELLNNQS